MNIDSGAPSQEATSDVSEVTLEAPVAEATDAVPAVGETPTEATDAKPAEGTDATAEFQYADFAVPEGMAMDQEKLDWFKGVAKAGNISPEAQAELFDAYIQQAKSAATAVETFKQEQAEQRIAQDRELAEQVAADKELGGARLNETLALSVRAIDTFAGKDADAFKQLLTDNGLASHPVVIRTFRNIGKAIRGGPTVGGNSTGGGKPFYGNSQMNPT
jgi:hypothetical protein